MQGALNVHCGRVRAAEDLPRGPSRVLERGHGLANIVERGVGVVAALYDAVTARTEDALYAASLTAIIATLYVGGNVAFLAALRHKDSVAVRAGVAANYAFAAGLAALLGLWIVNRHGHHWTVLWTRVLGVAFCLSVVPDFRPLWREHAPAAGERLHLPTLVAAGGAAVVVLASLALAATDPKAEDVVLDMFAGV